MKTLGLSLALALAFLISQALLGVHELEHQFHSESDPCMVCTLATAPALPSIKTALLAPVVPWLANIPVALDEGPAVRPQRAPVARAPPS